MSVSGFFGFGKKPSHYELSEMANGLPLTTVTSSDAAPPTPDIKSETDQKSIPLDTSAPESKNCTTRMLKFLGWHHPEVSFPKKIVQSMWAMILALDVRSGSMNIYEWLTAQFVDWFPPSDPDNLENINAYASQIIGCTIGAVAYLYFQRTIGDNLENTVKENANIQILEKALAEHNKVVKVIQTALELIARHQRGKQDAIDEKHDHMITVQDRGAPLKARLSQSSLSVEAKRMNEPDQKGARAKCDRVMSYVHPGYFYPTVTAPQIARQTAFSLIPSFSLTMGLTKTIAYLADMNIVAAATISAIFIPLPTFFINQKTLGKNTRDSNLYQEHLKHASTFVVHQKQLLDRAGEYVFDVLASQKPTTATQPSSNTLSNLITKLEAEIKKDNVTSHAPTPCNSLVQNILEKVFYSYPHVPWKKDVLKTLFAAQAGFDLYSAILSIAALGDGHEILAVKVFAGIMASTGAYSAQASVGTDISNSESHKDFVDEFIAHMKKQRNKLAPLLPALRYLIERMEIDSKSEDHNIKQNLLSKDLAIVEAFIQNEAQPTSLTNAEKPPMHALKK